VRRRETSGTQISIGERGIGEQPRRRGPRAREHGNLGARVSGRMHADEDTVQGRHRRTGESRERARVDWDRKASVPRSCVTERTWLTTRARRLSALRWLVFNPHGCTTDLWDSWEWHPTERAQRTRATLRTKPHVRAVLANTVFATWNTTLGNAQTKDRAWATASWHRWRCVAADDLRWYGIVDAHPRALGDA